MKLNSSFVTHNSGDEQIMVATGKNAFSGLVRNNKTAAFIVDQLKTEKTLDEIVDAVFEKYDAPREVIEADVKRVIESLKKVGAIDD